MKLTRFETEVLRHLLQDRLAQNEWQVLLSGYKITNYDFTGAGYFLEVACSGIKLDKETIHQPFIKGNGNNLEVGFLLFVEGNNITIECHGWSDENLPDNFRRLDLQITIEK